MRKSVELKTIKLVEFWIKTIIVFLDDWENRCTNFRGESFALTLQRKKGVATQIQNEERKDKSFLLKITIAKSFYEPQNMNT